MLGKRSEEIGKILVFSILFYLAFSKLNLWFLIVPALLILPSIRTFRGWFFAGFLSFLLSLLWIRIAMIDYGGVYPIVAYSLIVLLVLFLTLYQFGLTYLLWRLFKFNVLLLPFLWVLAEVLRSHIPYGGFPWLILGELSVDFPFLKSYLSAGGVFLGSLMLFYLSLIPYLIRRRVGIVVLLLLFLLPAPFFNREVREPKDLKLATIQPVVPEEVKLDRRRFYGYLPKYWELMDEAIKYKPDIIFLPESAFPFFAEELYSKGEKLLAYSHKAVIVTGLIDIRYGEGWEPYNSVFVIHGGKVLDFYDKTRLLPFGEYVPFPFGFVKEIFGAIAGIDYTPGRGTRCLKLDGIRIGTPICFEVSYFGLVRGMAECADLLAVLTNDGWFRDSDGTFQHLRQARVRALENGRYLLWVNNTGPSAVISPQGEILKEIPYGKPGVLFFSFQE